ncbi:MAG: segregation/condensation protein A [Gammaproteobacteria bacterium]
MNDSAVALLTDPPLVRVGGEPFTRLPHDLYIPPDALEVFLEAFEGPLDLLLYLIKRQKIDILHIPLAEITRQYMAYLALMQELKLELAAEYLVMAALLAEIKSRLLLPKPTRAEDEGADPRAELVRRLQEYERCKRAAEDLDALPRLERDLFVATAETSPRDGAKPQPAVSLAELLQALGEMLARAQHYDHHHIQREPLSVRERMSRILETLANAHFTPFVELFSPSEGRRGVVVTLLAVLELTREALIEMVQTEPFAPIYLRLPA